MSNDTASSADYWRELYKAAEREVESDLYPPDQASTLGGQYYYTELER